MRISQNFITGIPSADLEHFLTGINWYDKNGYQIENLVGQQLKRMKRSSREGCGFDGSGGASCECVCRGKVCGLRCGCSSYSPRPR